MNEEKNQTDEELIDDENESAEEKIKKIKNDLKLCTKEKADYLEGWQRAKADFINARKEEEKSREQFMIFAAKEVLNDFLSVADSFDVAMQDSAWDKIDPKWREGTERIYKQLTQILQRHNVKTMETKGLKFNPSEHESLEEVKVKDKKLDKIIIEELQKGYKINNQVLRPAKVKVGVYKES